MTISSLATTGEKILLKAFLFVMFIYDLLLASGFAVESLQADEFPSKQSCLHLGWLQEGECIQAVFPYNDFNIV